MNAGTNQHDIDAGQRGDTPDVIAGELAALHVADCGEYVQTLRAINHGKPINKRRLAELQRSIGRVPDQLTGDCQAVAALDESVAAEARLPELLNDERLERDERAALEKTHAEEIAALRGKHQLAIERWVEHRRRIRKGNAAATSQVAARLPVARKTLAELLSVDSEALFDALEIGGEAHGD